MDELRSSPFECHVFVCTNNRYGARKSCADGDNIRVRAVLKEKIAERGWKGRVRISQSGCLGLCEDGPNVLIYPQKIWCCAVTEDDIDAVMSQIEKSLQS